jgi:hypothetical protein
VMPRPVVRGNPQIDQATLDSAKEFAEDAKLFAKMLRGNQKNLDAETISKITEQLHRVEAEVAASRAILEKLRRIRDQQSTALVGGGRRKR